MLVTTSDEDFMAALDPGDLLLFNGQDPMDRLVQWIDGSNFNHVGVWLGDLERTVDNQTVIKRNQTIHAGLSTRSLSAEVKEQLFGANGRGERNGTCMLLDFRDVIDPGRTEEVGGTLNYHMVTAMRWIGTDRLNVDRIRDYSLGYLQKRPAPEFDFSQLPALARFWIERAYSGPGLGELTGITVELFGDMKKRLTGLAKEIERYQDKEADKLTCSRFVYNAYEQAGHKIEVPAVPTGVTAPGPVAAYVTPSDIARSQSVTAVAHYVRPPTSRPG